MHMRGHKVQNEIDELRQLRLDEGLTYEALAELIGDIDPSTLNRLMREPDRKPFDTTLHRIRRFLDERRSATRPTRKAATR